MSDKQDKASRGLVKEAETVDVSAFDAGATGATGPPPPPPKGMRGYELLIETTEGRGSIQWEYVGFRDARSAKAAIVDEIKLTGREGTYIAVPSRSFKPMTVRTETTTQTKMVFE